MKRIILILTVIILILIYFLVNNSYTYQEIPNSDVSVEIKGAVNKPGVYKLEYGSRVDDLIKKSGNLTDNADTSTINLSKKLNDEMVVIVYTKDEINEMRNGSASVKYVERQCTCPMIENDACIEDIISNNAINNKEGLVSINTGTIEELMTLPGIGKAKAEAIIKYREENGGFKKIEDIMNIKGIGNSMYEKIKNYIML